MIEHPDHTGMSSNPDAPWNQPDDPWQTGELDDVMFSCNECGFEIIGRELIWLEYETGVEAVEGNAVHECPACLVAMIDAGYSPWSEPSEDDVPSKLGYIRVPHVCGVTVACECHNDEQ